ncbi:MAG: hypothetical protein E7233_03045 [Lachnospiraceae bacterium]|nr:hypothetical protein [Lachnospiraceae bacterium]
MKLINKIISLILIVVIVCGIAACAGSDNTPSQTGSETAAPEETIIQTDQETEAIETTAEETTEEMVIPEGLDLSQYSKAWEHIDTVKASSGGAGNMNGPGMGGPEGGMMGGPEGGMGGPGNGNADADVAGSAETEEAEMLEANCYALFNVPYCTSPVDPEVQVMNIYVPDAYMTEEADGSIVINPDGIFTNSDGTTYTAQTAPIIYQNTIDAYKEGTPIVDLGASRKGNSGHYADYLASGYVLVSVGTRGNTSTVTDASGNEIYCGTGNAFITDLKAGVRFLKVNDSQMAGDAEKIIATGGSAGGGAASLLAASGNTDVFDKELSDIGAAEAPDDIFAGMIYCPITDMENADADYDLLHYSQKAKAGMGGGEEPIDTEVAKALAMTMIERAETFGSELIYDEQADTFKGEFIDGLNTYVEECYQKLYDSKNADEQKALLEENDFLTVQDGKVSTDFYGFITARMSRKKGELGFDSPNNTSNEAGIFMNEDGTKYHFSVTDRDILNELMDKYADSDETIRLQELNEEIHEFVLIEKPKSEYYADIVPSYDEALDSEVQELAASLNPLTFIMAADSSMAKHWRFNIGEIDGDAGFMTAYLMSLALGNAGVSPENADINLIYDCAHGAMEDAPEDVQIFIDSICK